MSVRKYLEKQTMKKTIAKLSVVVLLTGGCASNDPWNGTHWNGVHKSMTCDRMLPVWRQGICPDCTNITPEQYAKHLNKKGLVAQR